LRRQLNKDTRVNLASAGLFSAADYLQARAGPQTPFAQLNGVTEAHVNRVEH
jgi:hypothetical protein